MKDSISISCKEHQYFLCLFLEKMGSVISLQNTFTSLKSKYMGIRVPLTRTKDTESLKNTLSEYFFTDQKKYTQCSISFPIPFLKCTVGTVLSASDGLITSPN